MKKRRKFKLGAVCTLMVVMLSGSMASAAMIKSYSHKKTFSWLKYSASATTNTSNNWSASGIYGTIVTGSHAYFNQDFAYKYSTSTSATASGEAYLNIPSYTTHSCDSYTTRYNF